jgi:valyl-tRNA synthetase
MPFVTEELWQRLPQIARVAGQPSIVITAYPESVQQWHRPDAEAAMEIVKDAAHAARSLRTDYRVTNRVRGTFFLRTDSSQVATALIDQVTVNS